MTPIFFSFFLILTLQRNKNSFIYHKNIMQCACGGGRGGGVNHLSQPLNNDDLNQP